MDTGIHILLLLLTSIISYNIISVVPSLEIVSDIVRTIVKVLCLLILRIIPIPNKNNTQNTFIQYVHQLIYYQFKNIDINKPLPSSIIMYKLLLILNNSSNLSAVPIKLKSRSRIDQVKQSQSPFSKIISKSISGVTVDLSSKDVSDFIVPIDKTLLKALQDTDNSRKSQMLCLDLDETLIHSALDPKISNEHEFLLYDEEHRQYFFVFKRPFVDLFLTTLSHFYDISVFTASYSCYSSPIMDYIDPYNLITKKFYNTSLTPTNAGLEKDLRIVSETHVPHKIIMVDNSKTACVTHRENLYVINSYKAERNDDIELLSLIPLLLALAPNNICDTRAILHRLSRNKENKDTNTNINNILSNAHTDIKQTTTKSNNDEIQPKKVSVKL